MTNTKYSAMVNMVLPMSDPLKGTELTRNAIDPGFWFEWVAFHPDTEVFGDDRN